MNTRNVGQTDYNRLRAEALSHLATFDSFLGNTDIQLSRDAWFAFLQTCDFAKLRHTTRLAEYRYPEDNPDECPLSTSTTMTESTWKRLGLNGRTKAFAESGVTLLVESRTPRIP